MNIVIEQGRPTREPEMQRSERTGKVYCKIRLAVDKPYASKDTKKADYFNVIVFDKLAQFVYNNLAKGALCTVLGRLSQEDIVDKYGDRKEHVSIIAQRITIHEWLRKHRPLSELEHDFDETLVPREITKSLFKQIDVSDEDIPTDLLGRSIDDIV